MGNRRILLIIFVLAILGCIVWYFTDIIFYVFIALVLSLLGSPVVKLLTKIKIGKQKHIPTSVAATITLLLLLSIMGIIGYLLLPLISYEAQQVRAIDTSVFIDNFDQSIQGAEHWLQQKHLVSKEFNLSKLISKQASNLLESFHISSLLGGVVNFLTSLFICIFSVLFMTFFTLKEEHIFRNMLKKNIPTTLRNNFDNILEQTKGELARYFIGVLSEMAIVGICDGLLCFILGIPNALLIGVVGGLLNIIPYVGPLLACGISMLIAITSTLAGAPAPLLPITIKVGISFIIVKMLDDFLLQPIIYGKSVHAHPLEIFIVILVAGKIGGIWGMMFGVPAYTIIRVIFKEFFGQYFLTTEPQENDHSEPSF